MRRSGLTITEVTSRHTFFVIVKPLITFLERKLGLVVVFEARSFRLIPQDEFQLLQLAEKLNRDSVIQSVIEIEPLPEQPRVFAWYCTVGEQRHALTAGGTSLKSSSDALTAMLAEAIERYIWFTQTDYFIHPMTARTDEIKSYGQYIPPESFVSFSPEQRASDPELRLTPEAGYRWIQATSLVNNKPVYLPAQTVSATVPTGIGPHLEPLIRAKNTNGLATWPTRAGAQLAGCLELVEREAYMVMWFNQLTLPRFTVAELRKLSPSLEKLIASCEKQGMRVHVIHMLTDAPTYAICVVVENKSDSAPRFSFGLKAHRSLAHATEKALLEALRAQSSTTHRVHHSTWNSESAVETIGQRDRLLYWAMPEHARRLEFLITGPEIIPAHTPWDNDSEEKHLARIIAWCKEKQFECASVSFGTSKANPTLWFIEMIVIPQLHPIHLHERRRHLALERLQEIPREFGYKPRATPYIDAPHPFS